MPPTDRWVTLVDANGLPISTTNPSPIKLVDNTGVAYTAANPVPVTLATLIAGEDQPNNAIVTKGRAGWCITHAPAVNTKATISQAAGAGSIKNVCTGLSFIASTGTTAPTAIQLTVNLRDGATGAGTILKSWTVVLPAAVGYNFGINLSGLWIEGSAATAMTIEFSAAGGANTFESVTMCGTTIT